jgi:uncharacterized membrane protein YjjB (DUF3815 family)
VADVSIYIDPKSGTNYPVSGSAFADATTDEQIFTRWLAAQYASGNVSVLVDWYSRTGQTTGAVVWGAALSVLTPGDAQSIEADAFATENTQTTTVTGTARALTRSTITVSNLDSLAADDSVELRITRRQSNGSDTMTGDAVIVGITVRYLST